MPIQILIKLTQIKEGKILKVTREKQQIIYKGITTRLNSSGQKIVVEYI